MAYGRRLVQNRLMAANYQFSKTLFPMDRARVGLQAVRVECPVGTIMGDN